MSGPQGTDPSQGWSGQQPGFEQQPAWGQPAPGTEQPPAAAPAWQQPPAYNPEQYQYPSMPQTSQQPGGYPQYGQQPGYQQPGAYGQPQPPGAYPQYGQPHYGQPGAYPQYGQPGMGQEFDQQFGQPSKPKNNKTLLAIGGGIAAVILLTVIVLGFVWPGWFVTTKLDVNAAQQGVQKILSDETSGYGVKNVKNVKCNDGADPEVKAGATFNCSVSIDGTSRTVTVTFKDDKGTYEVGRPQNK